MEFKLPELGEGVNEGELVSWKVKVGDQVSHDQPLCEVMTDKATIEIPSPASGKVTAIHAQEGDTILVDQLLLSFDGAESSAPAPEKKHEEKKPEPAAETQTPAASPAPTPTPTPAPSAPMDLSPSKGDSVMAAPSTRRMARELGIDLSMVSGTGPEGRVLQEDVIRFGTSGMGAVAAGSARIASPSRAMVGGEERVKFKGLRRKIAQRMRESKDRAAHFTYVEEADCTSLVLVRKEAKDVGAEKGIKVTFLPFIMKAMVAALKKYPILNCSLDEEAQELVYKHYFNISLSVQTDEGLTAPVVKNVEQKSILELSQDIQGLVERARNKQLTMDDLKGGTITLTNAGTIGGLFATPVINYPEVAILGFNKIFKKPVVKTVHGKDEVVVRDWTYFSISLDHRIVDGAIGAEFMKEFIRYIENPSLLLLETGF